MFAHGRTSVLKTGGGFIVAHQNKNMKLPRASSSKEVPKYTIGYWLIIWATLFFVFFALNILGNITPDGKYLKEIPCIMSGGNGPDRECIEWGDPIYSPVGTETKGLFIRIGIGTAIFSFLFGGLIYADMKVDEKSTKMSDGRRRSIKRIIESAIYFIIPAGIILSYFILHFLTGDL